MSKSGPRRRLCKPRVIVLAGGEPPEPPRPHALILVNGSFHGYSGGDLHIAHAARYWSAVAHVEIVLPVGSSTHVEELFGVPSTPHTRVPSGYATMLLHYLRRTIAAICLVLTRPFRWNVVIASTHYPFDIAPIVAARGPVTRAVYWHHHLEPGSSRPYLLRALLRISEEATARLVRLRHIQVLTSSLSTRDYLITRGVPPDRIAITQQGTSIHNDLLSSEAVPPVDDRRFVLFCSRQSRVKGAHTLASIVPAALHHDNETCVVMCGSRGDCTDMITELAERYASTGRVFSVGFVSDEVKDWLQARAHVLVAPSEEEGWGYGVGEGLQHGAWVVAYAVPAVRAAHPTGPIYVPVGDIERVVKEVIGALGKPRPGPATSTTLRSWREVTTADWKHIVGRAAAHE